MARKYVIVTYDGSKYFVEKVGIASRKWVAFMIDPKLWPQAKTIYTFTDNVNLIEQHKTNPGLTLNKLRQYVTYREPKGVCSMLFKDGTVSEGIRTIFEIKGAD